MAEEFFNEKPAESAGEPEKVKIGEAEYSQEDLSRLVGLGKLAEEAETKYNRDITKFWPEFTKSQQKTQEMEKELNELKSFKTRLTQPDIVTPTQDELIAQAREQARSIGLTDEETTRRIYREERAAEKLLESIDQINKEAKEAGKPTVDQETLVKYMRDEDYRSPERAYNDMFRDDLDKWEKEKVKEIKPTGFTTQSSVNSGAKQPVIETPKTKEELMSALDTFWKSEGEGAENA